MKKINSLESIKHFGRSEFACSCGCGLGWDHMQPQALKKLELARKYSNVPYVINSSIRCEDYNAKIGGAQTSAHKIGWAFDLEARTSARRARILFGLVKAGFHRIGIYKTFIHVDDDPSKPPMVVWL